VRLTDPWFDATFFGFVAKNEQGQYTSRHVHEDRRPVTFAEAQGVQFWCPCGFGKPAFPIDGGRPHLVMVPFNGRGLPDDFGPHSRTNANDHPRWNVSGSSLDDLTTTPSVAVGDPECWHGFIANGEIK
jgi:hypothetical protein